MWYYARKIVRHAVKNNLIGLENLNGVRNIRWSLNYERRCLGRKISENLIHVELINSKNEIKKF